MTEKQKKRYNVELKNKMVEFRMTESDFKKLEQKSKEAGQNVSETIRTLIKEFIK